MMALSGTWVGKDSAFFFTAIMLQLVNMQYKVNFLLFLGGGLTKVGGMDLGGLGSECDWDAWYEISK